MIRVLHIINGAALGGISSMILNYYKNIDRKQFHFDFIYSVDEPLGHNGLELKKLGADFYYVPKKSDGLMAHISGIMKVLEKHEYHAIHVHSSHTSYVALYVANKCGIPIRVAHAHNAVKDKLCLKMWISRKIGNVLIKRYATTRLACSLDAAVYTYGEKSVIESNTLILPNAIDADKFVFDTYNRDKIRSELNIPKQSFVLGTVGRMTVEKNQIFLVDVFKKVNEIIPDSKLILVGDGDQRINIEKRVDTLGLKDSVLFLGQRTDIPSLLNAFDIFAMPSLYEGFPIAGIEAGTNGLPLVLSDTITRELNFLPNVKYVSLSRIEDWSQSICSMRELKRNDRALELVKKNSFDIRVAAKNLEKIYRGDKLIENNK